MSAPGSAGIAIASTSPSAAIVEPMRITVTGLVCAVTMSARKRTSIAASEKAPKPRAATPGSAWLSSRR